MILLLLACKDDPKPEEETEVEDDAPRIVPQPVSVRVGDGMVLVDPADVTTSIDPSLGAEAYTLTVDADGVDIVGGDDAGVYYATQTLRQLLPPASLVDGAPGLVPAVTIEDAPLFVWRGYMLDVARHFFTVAEVQRQLDLMALHKLNRLHLHLSDDQGWRIEITGWPDLTTIGGSTAVGGGEGGWYSQADYAAIVAYAAERHIVVVPEIDFPGHSHAALASYPELNESGVAPDLYTGAGVISTPLWLDGDVTREFVADVWTEVAALTPGPWLHAGADEAGKADPDDYTVFVGWVQELHVGLGKEMVGWDEIGEVPLVAPFTAQHWYDEERAYAAFEQGATIVSSPAEHCYLDMVHDDDAEFGQVWAGAIDVERAYDWDPVPFGMDGAVAGVEGALWTEYIDSQYRIDFMTWPRLAALAEVGWSERRDWEDFRGRLAWHGARLEALDVDFYRSPEIDWIALE